jgi:hypothetical protein
MWNSMKTRLKKTPLLARASAYNKMKICSLEDINEMLGLFMWTISRLSTFNRVRRLHVVLLAALLTLKVPDAEHRLFLRRATVGLPVHPLYASSLVAITARRHPACLVMGYTPTMRCGGRRGLSYCVGGEHTGQGLSQKGKSEHWKTSASFLLPCMAVLPPSLTMSCGLAAATGFTRTGPEYGRWGQR